MASQEEELKVQNLCRRFPAVGEDEIRRQLQASNGHAGEVAARLKRNGFEEGSSSTPTRSKSSRGVGNKASLPSSESTPAQAAGAGGSLAARAVVQPSEIKEEVKESVNQKLAVEQKAVKTTPVKSKEPPKSACLACCC
mmetsp:Transcript_11854/g.22134  ORF Transcript_11854/g.22134 Transcript_11854/m.22134 type:complete len:139 (-) Transcript_11854:45-461(-)